MNLPYAQGRNGDTFLVCGRMMWPILKVLGSFIFLVVCLMRSMICGWVRGSRKEEVLVHSTFAVGRSIGGVGVGHLLTQ